MRRARGTVAPVWFRWCRLRDLLEAFVRALDDAVTRIDQSADRVIAALEAAGTGGEDTAAAVTALNGVADKLDAAAGDTGAGTPPPAVAPVMPIAGGTPEQPAG